jgi:predicted MFS family arabinose efflux permease
MAVAPFFEWMVAVRTLLAVCAGTFTGTAIATAAMLAPQGQRGRYMQVITIGQSLAALIGVPIGALVATQLDWRLNYWAITAMAVPVAAARHARRHPDCARAHPGAG